MILSPLVIDEARKRIAKTFPEHSTRFEEFLAVADYELAPVPSAEEVLGLAGEIVEYIQFVAHK
ncbi:MAG TPA: hypothetical protein EYP55_09770 [Anaerolineae bacterium]|nr:hypothetical protein [Anaerolineae bacterium]